MMLSWFGNDHPHLFSGRKAIPDGLSALSPHGNYRAIGSKVRGQLRGVIAGV
jgi:hypothetical protein